MAHLLRNRFRSSIIQRATSELIREIVGKRPLACPTYEIDSLEDEYEALDYFVDSSIEREYEVPWEQFEIKPTWAQAAQVGQEMVASGAMVMQVMFMAVLHTSCTYGSKVVEWARAATFAAGGALAVNSCPSRSSYLIFVSTLPFDPVRFLARLILDMGGKIDFDIEVRGCFKVIDDVLKAKALALMIDTIWHSGLPSNLVALGPDTSSGGFSTPKGSKTTKLDEKSRSARRAASVGSDGRPSRAKASDLAAPGYFKYCDTCSLYYGNRVMVCPQCKATLQAR